MNQSAKRYRQTNIMESFAFSKRPKNTLMEEATNNEVLLADSLQNESSPEVPVRLKECKNKDESNEYLLFSSVEEQYCDTSDTKNRKENCDPVASTSKSIIDQIWENRYTDVKNENHQAARERPTLKSVIGQSLEDYEDSLFQEDSTLKDDSVPSSSASQELFVDSQQSIFESDTPEEYSEEQNYKSPEITESSSESDESDEAVVFNRSPDCDMPLPKLEPSEKHSIMFSPHIRPGDAPRPYPKEYKDKWDFNHVRMPCSSSNKYPVENSIGEVYIGSRWDLVGQSLLSNIYSSEDLETAIMKYNHQNFGKWNFLGLHYFINQIWVDEEREYFFEELLPAMIEMALSLPTICTQPVPLLKKNRDHYVTMSQKQIGCLLLNAFFCTFPRRNPRNKQKWNLSEYASYPDINFNRLYYGTKSGIPPRNAQKLKCLFNYFRRITSKEPSGTVTFHRQVISYRNFPTWYSSSRGIRAAVIKSHGLIEHEGKGLLQVDFANRFVGGGVLGSGCVQEEIRFLTCPELIVSRLFVESLESNEALIIIGAEEYNKYSGYCDTFKWEGDVKDKTPRDSWGRRCTKIVAIDAIHFRNSSAQYSSQNLKRELNKAYCGFYENTPPDHLAAVATGNWGCGAFNGSPDLKFLIQLMAASQCGRAVLYFTFENKKLKRKLQDMYQFISDKNLSVGELSRIVTDYITYLNAYEHKKQLDLYSFIYSQFTTKKPSPQQENRNELTDSCEMAAELLFEELTKDSSSQGSEDIT